jgi:MFS family permease
MGITTVAEVWRLFTPAERRNIAIYTIGIIVYKFGLEAFNGSVVALATNRYDYDAITTKTQAKTFERIGLLTGLNQAFQVFGSIIIAPLVKRYPTKNVMSAAILVFAVFSAILLIVDAATGGQFLPADYRGVGKHPKNQYWYYGKFNTDGMIPIFAICGVAFGMVELIRRIIPRDIVGGDVRKLRTMDAIVRIIAFDLLPHLRLGLCALG